MQEESPVSPDNRNKLILVRIPFVQPVCYAK
jgi:hypothetical protein